MGLKLDGFNEGAFAPEHIVTLKRASATFRDAHRDDPTAKAIDAVLLHVGFVDCEVAASRGESDGGRMGGRSPGEDFPEAPCDVAAEREAMLRYPHDAQKQPRQSYAAGFERGYIRGAARCLESAVDECEPDEAVIFARRIDPADGPPTATEFAARWVAAGDGEDADGIAESLFQYARDLWTRPDED